jgi:hypothetical protein
MPVKVIMDDESPTPRRRARWRSLAAAVVGVAILAAACTAEADPAVIVSGTEPGAPAAASTVTPPTQRAVSFTVDQVPPTKREFGPEALVISDIPDIPTEIRYEDPAFGPPKVRSGDLRRGGSPPDGIPAIDHPRFHRGDEVDFLSEQEPVFVLEVEGEARAYPLQIMMWHEIVNDTVAGIPVAVTYCPLCNSAFAYDRRVGERVLDFGVSGALWNSSLVMYDRQTRSLWSHFTGEGILGVLSGVELTGFPVTLASWSEFQEAHPDGLVLSRDTGFVRQYGRNPYPGYDDVSVPPFLFDGEVDGRYAAKTRVVGLDLPEGPVAVTAERLAADRVVPVELEGRSVIVWWQPGTGSALDTSTVADGRDVGATGAFEPAIDGRTLTFEAVDGGGFRDLETGSTWNVFGTATGGALAGRQLPAVAHVDTFWFAWGAFEPDTEVIG